MKLKALSVCLVVSLLFTGCARDLSSNVYTSDSSLNLTLEGQVIASRPIIVKESDKLSDSTLGMVAGGVFGGVAGSNAGGGGGQAAMIAAGAIAGAIVGSIVESKLSQADGMEYVVKVDRSQISDGYYEGSAVMRNAIAAAKATGLITIIQGKDQLINVGQGVYIILSPKRARVIAK
ncbi:hypothetical protein [Rickettsiales endosymbiont of Peranema trichophorum]|uniref:hypothetical protein n=1 Tax=Rickettsiales endosymbiont of Peranema trichophorum TaxID=2486577 RepID=UPI0013EE5D4E|nr:hypothetical protein [Rickettsiales endosymbiont of Peranema trichophorum]